WSQCIHGGGKTFKDVIEFRIYVKYNVIASKISFLYKKNDSAKLIVVCSASNCRWRIYSSKHKSDYLFGIRQCNLELSCRSRGHPRADIFGLNIVKDKLHAINKDIHREYCIELEYYKLWMGKRSALHEINGNDKNVRGRLQWYCSVL
ncbi:hypothetical protein F511_39810, partial [Dorcoceras hygrometricum]